MEEMKINTSTTNSILKIYMNAIENTKNKMDKLKVGQKCDDCTKHIVQTTQLLNGVIQAKWDNISGMLLVEYNPDKISLKRIELAISEAGHDTPNFTGKNNYYSLMPQCCQFAEK